MTTVAFQVRAAVCRQGVDPGLCAEQADTALFSTVMALGGKPIMRWPKLPGL